MLSLLIFLALLMPDKNACDFTFIWSGPIETVYLLESVEWEFRTLSIPLLPGIDPVFDRNLDLGKH